MTFGIHDDSYDSSSAPMDRMDAAHALLGVSPKTVLVLGPLSAAISKNLIHASYTTPSADRILSAPSSGGLDALAALASSMEESSTNFTPSSAVLSSSDDDSEAMPPPPPRRRERSCSNPEGMEKWDSLNRISERRRFVLPTSILEEELAEARIAADRKQEQDRLLQQEISIPDTAISFGFRDEEAFVGPDELLRRARSRLLEDLSEGSITGEKGQITLPHSLGKYKHVYNKNGRIGIYTPSERAAIISRFHNKRSRRVWNKKIRYNCRKNLADRRLRVKGRFVKRAVVAKHAKPAAVVANVVDSDMPDVTDPEAGFCPTEDQPFRRTRRHTIT